MLSTVAPTRRSTGRPACMRPQAHHAGGRRGKERAASLRAEQRLAAGGAQRSPDPKGRTHHNYLKVAQRSPDPKGRRHENDQEVAQRSPDPKGRRHENDQEVAQRSPDPEKPQQDKARSPDPENETQNKFLVGPDPVPHLRLILEMFVRICNRRFNTGFTSSNQL